MNRRKKRTVDLPYKRRKRRRPDSNPPRKEKIQRLSKKAEGHFQDVLHKNSSQEEPREQEKPEAETTITTEEEEENEEETQTPLTQTPPKPSNSNDNRRYVDQPRPKPELIISTRAQKKEAEQRQKQAEFHQRFIDQQYHSNYSSSGNYYHDGSNQHYGSQNYYSSSSHGLHNHQHYNNQSSGGGYNPKYHHQQPLHQHFSSYEEQNQKNNLIIAQLKKKQNISLFKQLNPSANRIVKIPVAQKKELHVPLNGNLRKLKLQNSPIAPRGGIPQIISSMPLLTNIPNLTSMTNNGPNETTYSESSPTLKPSPLLTGMVGATRRIVKAPKDVQIIDILRQQIETAEKNESDETKLTESSLNSRKLKRHRLPFSELMDTIAKDCRYSVQSASARYFGCFFHALFQSEIGYETLRDYINRCINLMETQPTKFIHDYICTEDRLQKTIDGLKQWSRSSSTQVINLPRSLWSPLPLVIAMAIILQKEILMISNCGDNIGEAYQMGDDTIVIAERFSKTGEVVTINDANYGDLKHFYDNQELKLLYWHRSFCGHWGFISLDR